MKKILFLTAVLAVSALTTFAQGGRGYDDRGDDVYRNNPNSEYNSRGGSGSPGGGYNGQPGYGGRPGGAACGSGGYGGGGYNSGYGRNSVNGCEYVQQSRIYQGIRDGSLNRWEAQRLQRELGRIERMEWTFRQNDGRLDFRERRILDGELDRLSWNVRRERNDRRWN